METTETTETTVSHATPRASNWWGYLIAGCILVILGIRVFQFPGTAYLGLSMWFAIAMLVNGVANTIFAFSNRVGFDSWSRNAVLGLAEAGLGLYMLVVPPIAIGTLALVIGWWLLFRSIVLINNAFGLRKEGDPHWGWVLAAAVVGGILAVLVLANPVIGTNKAPIWVAMSLVVMGGAACVLAFRLRLGGVHFTGFL